MYGSDHVVVVNKSYGNDSNVLSNLKNSKHKKLRKKHPN